MADVGLCGCVQDKGVAATLKGAFTAESIDRFVLSLTTGGEKPAPLAGAINISKVAEWDGKDAEIVQEEEFSLDDIMNEL